VYSISFAHSISFHEHGFYSEHQFEFSERIASEHNHEHHIHSVDEDLTTEHINHNDHCDEGIFDLITCVLSDLSNHNHTDCEFEHQSNKDTKRLTNKNTQSVLWIDNSENIDRDSAVYLFYNQLIDGVRFSLIDNTPLRGPPISC